MKVCNAKSYTVFLRYKLDASCYIIYLLQIHDRSTSYESINRKPCNLHDNEYT